MQKEFASLLSRRSLLLLVCSNTLQSVCAYAACICNQIPVMLEDEGIAKERLEDLIQRFEPEYLYLPCKTECLYEDLFENRGYESIRLEKALQIEESDRTITSMQMSYSYGLSILNTYLYQGASVVLTEKKVYTPAFWKLAVSHQITSFSGVPAVYEIFRKLNLQKYDLSSLKVMTQAGGKMEDALWDFMNVYAKDHNIRFYVMYGQTEATARMSVLEPEQMTQRKGSVGRAILGGRLSLRDENGQAVTKANEEGELIYHGSNVSMGYAVSRGDLEKGDENRGTLKTGDLGYFVEVS